MTQTQMTAYLADKIGISKRQAKSALDELNELIALGRPRISRHSANRSTCATLSWQQSFTVALQCEGKMQCANG